MVARVGEEVVNDDRLSFVSVEGQDVAQLIQAQQEEEGRFDVQMLALEFLAAGKLMIGAADWPEMGRSGKKVSKSLSNVKDHKLNNGTPWRGWCEQEGEYR